MTAAELRAIAKRIGNLEPYSSAEVTNDLATVEKDYECVAQAAEVLELIAWAEEIKPMLGLYGDRWGISLGRRHSISSSSLIDTLRRAREVAR